MSTAPTDHPTSHPTREAHPALTATDLADENLLNQLGYTQSLSRTWNGAQSFGISFSIISVVTGITTLFSYGLNTGGSAVMLIGWIVVAGFTMAVAGAMAEIVSSVPTSGGPCTWDLSSRDA